MEGRYRHPSLEALWLVNGDAISAPDRLAALRSARTGEAEGGLVRVRDVVGGQQRRWKTVVRGSLRAAHGKEAEAKVSGYYLADEISAEYRTLAKYILAQTCG